MKVAANYTAFYGEAYVKYSLRSVYPFVDYILIALGEKSWARGAMGLRDDRIDNIEKALEEFLKEEDPDHKIIIFKGTWASDTIQRNFLLDRCRGLVDYALLVDTDEIWEPQELKTLLSYPKDYPNEKVFRVGIKHYYRSLYWRHIPDEHLVNYLVKVEGTKHKWIRAIVDTTTKLDVPGKQVPVWYHHYGYALPTKFVKKKISFWGHCGEVTDNWFEDIYTKWTPNGDVKAYSPTGDYWEPLKKCKLIDIMKDHPFAKKELIK